MSSTLSITWSVEQPLGVVQAAQALEPHFCSWFGQQGNLFPVGYTLFTDEDESFHRAIDYKPILDDIAGRPNALILHLAPTDASSAVRSVEVWHQRYSDAQPLKITIKLVGHEIDALRSLRDRSRERLASVVHDSMGSMPAAESDSIKIENGSSGSAEASVVASLFQKMDQAARVGLARPPRVFISYSHDSAEHKAWVAKLANRLNSLGVWLIFDQWDLELGGDLPRFMETGLTGADRVIAICTAAYNAKANRGVSGAGYEKMIMTADLITDQTSTKIIPLVRGLHTPATPTFLGSRFYVNFSDDAAFDAKLDELSTALLKPGSQRPPFQR